MAREEADCGLIEFDVKMMTQCIALSRASGAAGEYPYGAIISRGDQLVTDPFLTSVEDVAPRNYATFVIALMLLLGASICAKADDPHLGIIEYEISCLPCHGINGRGDGPRANLKTVPADLTQIAKHNQGEFPYNKVADMIDGRATVSAHGQREMPVWGDRYRASAQTNESAAWIDQRVREQIAALAKYLATLQEK